jgi:hypothetical protein
VGLGKAAVVARGPLHGRAYGESSWDAEVFGHPDLLAVEEDRRPWHGEGKRVGHPHSPLVAAEHGREPSALIVFQLVEGELGVVAHEVGPLARQVECRSLPKRLRDWAGVAAREREVLLAAAWSKLVRRRGRTTRTGLTLPRAPRAEMVRRHAGGEAGLFGLLDVAEQLRRVDLLMRTVKTDDSHAQGVPVLVRGAYVNVRSVVAAEATERLDWNGLAVKPHRVNPWGERCVLDCAGGVGRPAVVFE